MWVDNLWRLQNFITAYKIVILKEKKNKLWETFYFRILWIGEVST